MTVLYPTMCQVFSNFPNTNLPEQILPKAIPLIPTSPNRFSQKQFHQYQPPLSQFSQKQFTQYQPPQVNFPNSNFPNTNLPKSIFPTTISPKSTSPIQFCQQQFPQPLISPTTTSQITNIPGHNFPHAVKYSPMFPTDIENSM